MKKTKIYYIRLTDQEVNKYKKDIFESSKNLPLKRFQLYLSLEDQQAQIESLISYLLLIKALEDNNFLTTNLGFSYHRSGKPYFTNSNVKFNISHSEDIIAIAIDNEEIGLDVEKIEEVNANLISRVYSEQEKEIYKEKLLDSDFFFKTWTIKESYIKFSGIGLNADVTQLTFDLNSNQNKYEDKFINTVKINDFYLSLCTKKKEYQIRKISLEQLFNKS